jgi:hypothetical protein
MVAGHSHERNWTGVERIRSEPHALASGAADRQAGRAPLQTSEFGKGCAVYRAQQTPPECAFWNCRWLVNDDTADLPRPGSSALLIDVMPDYITVRPDETR